MNLHSTGRHILVRFCGYSFKLNKTWNTKKQEGERGETMHGHTYNDVMVNVASMSNAVHYCFRCGECLENTDPTGPTHTAWLPREWPEHNCSETRFGRIHKLQSLQHTATRWGLP